MPLALDFKPEDEYRYAYPNDLMNKIADIFLDGLDKSNISRISTKKLEIMNDDKVVRILNDAWKSFLNNPEKYNKWEVNTIEKLKSSL